VTVAIDLLLARLAAAGVRRAYAVVDRAKADLLRHLAAPGRGSSREPAVALLPITGSPSVPHSLDRAHPFLAPEPAPWVALGFPDVLFEPRDAFACLVERRRQTGAAVVLGLFPPRDPRTTDLVDAGQDGRVRRIEVRPEASDLRLNWLIALWDGRFTGFLHRWVAAAGEAEGSEPALGAAFGAALAAGLELQSVAFPEGRYLDLGTPGGYATALRRGSGWGLLS
jgi:glucose-1-phosphate thymidylyltransferase